MICPNCFKETELTKCPICFGVPVLHPGYDAGKPKIEIFIPGEPVPAVRMTRRDKWQKRECVQRQTAWRTKIQMYCLASLDKFKSLKYPISVDIEILPTGVRLKIYEVPAVKDRPRGDADNHAKLILDALSYKDKFLKGDSGKWVAGISAKFL